MTHDASADRLDLWIERNGPLAVPTALLLALDLCGAASRLPRSTRRRALAALSPSVIVRAPDGRWQWLPNSTPRQRPTLVDGVESIGIVLFHALTGCPVDEGAVSESAVRQRLRQMRRDLPAPVIDVVTEAIAGAPGRQANLASLAADLSHLLGAGRPDRRRTRRVITLTSALVAAALAVAWIFGLRNAHAGRMGGQLSETDLLQYDITREAAETFALMGEHSAASLHYQAAGRLLRTTLAPSDPRIAWETAQEAWVKALAGDWLSTEQLLTDLPGWLARELGDRHPYTSNVRIALAAALESRGLAAEATALRAAVDRATEDLFTPGGYRGWRGVSGSPGVAAHIAPNQPEREGFRRAVDGSYFIPLTSTQRWLAGQGGDGWQLHVAARRGCRVSVVVGASPQQFALETTQSSDGRWLVRVTGASPKQPLIAEASDTVLISIRAHPAGGIDARLGNGAVVPLMADPEAALPPPPYGLSFAGGDQAEACPVVWLQVQVAAAPPPDAAPAGAHDARTARIVIEHAGAADPVGEGFIDRGGIDERGPAPGRGDRPAWLIGAGRGCCSYYYRSIDNAAAFAQGWRLRGVVRVVGGSGFASLNLDPDGRYPRFDVRVAAEGDDAVVSLGGVSSSVRLPRLANQWVTVELRYDPRLQSATLFVNGEPRHVGYAGWKWAQENRGVMIAVNDARVHFSDVRFETGAFQP